MADRKIDPKTAVLLGELARRKEDGPHTEPSSETERDLSAFPAAQKSSQESSSSLFSSAFGNRPWIHRPREYYSGLDTLPVDKSKWTDEQREQVEKLKREGKIIHANAGPGMRVASPLAAGAVGLTSGAVLGFVGSTLQNAVQQHNHGWKGVFTRTGGTIWSFALAGGVYGVVDSGLKQYRQKGDALNKFSAGCAAGFMIGMQGKSLPLAIGTCVFLGGPVAILEAQGGSLRGDGKFEHTSLAGQKAQRYSAMFRKPPMTKAEREAAEKLHGMSAEEAGADSAHGKYPKVMSPALKAILEEKVADS